MKNLFTILGLLCFFLSYSQQETTFKSNGPDDYRKGSYAFIHATLFTDYKTKITDATLVIQDGKVIASGKGVALPKGCIIIDCTGKYIYPGFIDLYSDFGQPEVKKPKWNDEPQMENNQKGAYGWNQALHPEFESSTQFVFDAVKAEEYRKNGFSTLLTHRRDGIARGTGSLICLSGEKENLTIIKPDISAHYSFNKGSSTQDYPSSLMGSIALIRQTYYDAQWYERSKSKKEYNISLDHFIRKQKLFQVFETSDWQDVLRAKKIADEFGVNYIYKTNGTEYQRIEELKKERVSVITSLNFPKPYDVEDPYKAIWVSLEDMKHWELAPSNAAALNRAGISFTFSTIDLEKKEDFLKNLRLAVKFGLDSTEALKAITYTPAKMMNADNITGSLNPGMWANFIVTGLPLFDSKSVVNETWIQGIRFENKAFEPKDVRGTYDLTVDKAIYKLKIGGELNDLKSKVEWGDSSKQEAKVSIKKNDVTISFGLSKKFDEKILLSGEMDIKTNRWNGKGQMPDGRWVNWSAVFSKPMEKDTSKPKIDSTDYLKNIGSVIFPFTAYGNKEIPKQKTVLIRNATLWTNESQGNLENSDIVIRNGKISQVGKNLNCGECELIDGTGKHVTSGIIDEHNHIAISRGVNEGSEASSAEVRIGDVVNCEDVNMYRQLAGGVTAAQLLHGSANPIGGQSALIKFRWGLSPELLKIEKADGFIKFALGENVKQSNWGDKSTVRYPQTRMGVEQTYFNYFTKALEYERNLKNNRFDTRVDLELEALSEIINKKRFITCHSYVQSEINMLMHVADSFGFKVNTFTHILEGYKVAEKMKAHGVNASTFADWWAYKYEVIDAIPYNTAILTRMGVCTAVNSDDAEMARRLNQEAAKGVKYGGLSEVEAWKTVTLNPAIMLHLSDRTGSLKPGKDADIVLWSDNPLSIYAKAEKTFVDGVCYYDLATEQKKKLDIQQERARLIRKMLDEKRGGAPVQEPVLKKREAYDCGHGDHLE